MCDIRIAKFFLLTFKKFADVYEEMLPFLVKNQFNKKLTKFYYWTLKKSQIEKFLQENEEDEKIEISILNEQEEMDEEEQDV